MPNSVLFSSESAEAHLEYWRNQHPRPESYVYVVQPVGDPPIKVGTAVDVASRLAGLQTGNPRKLWLWTVLVGDSELECQLHRRLKNERLIGEWFDGPGVPEFMNFVAKLADEMLAAHQETGVLPHFRDFGAWERTRHQAPVTTRFVEPSPVSPDEIQRREEKAAFGYVRSSNQTS